MKLFSSLIRHSLLFVFLLTSSITAVSAESKAEIEQVVQSYLMENPEVVVEALEVYETRRIQQEELSQQNFIAENPIRLSLNPYSGLIGNPKGDVTVIEFFDYRCGYCKKVSSAVMSLPDFDSNVKVVFIELPILGPNSVLAAKASMASLKQESSSYETFHKTLMNSPKSLNKKVILEIASSVGLDVAKLEKDMEDPAIQDAINQNLETASQLNIRGTPAFVIGNKIIRGAVSQGVLLKSIADARKQKL